MTLDDYLDVVERLSIQGLEGPQGLKGRGIGKRF